MISVFLVNDRSIGIRNPSSVDVEINGVTSDAQRSDSGDLTTLNKVNSIPKVTVSWDYLTVAEMETLCALLNIDVADYAGTYTSKAIEDLVFKITARLPCGVRSFTAYVSDTLSATLQDYSGATAAAAIGGEYWSNVKLSLVGTGEQWRA